MCGWCGSGGKLPRNVLFYSLISLISWELKGISFRNIKDVSLYCLQLLFLSENQGTTDQFILIRHTSGFLSGFLVSSLLTDQS